jgi:hypothetical protein
MWPLSRHVIDLISTVDTGEDNNKEQTKTINKKTHKNNPPTKANQNETKQIKRQKKMYYF